MQLDVDLDDTVPQAPAPAPVPEPAAKKAKRLPRSNRWIFTLNNPGEFKPEWRPDLMEYLVWQIESGEEGTTHIQGYVRFKKVVSFNSVKQHIGTDRVHLEVAKGTEQQNKDYCTKADTRVAEGEEWGEFKPKAGTQGQRCDLEEIADKCKQGVPLQVIAADHAGDFIRYHAGIERLHSLIAPPPPIAREVTVILLWGPTGTGKTHRILNKWEDCYQVDSHGRDPWGMYTGQAVLFLDEFNWEQWTIQEMNKILDKWRFRLDARYRDKFAEWTTVAICANTNPASWWPSADAVLSSAIRRRLTGKCYFVDSQEPSLEEILTWQNNPF